MVSLTHLWMPIVVSAIFVFIASSLVHMVFKWHNSDYRKLPNEDAVRAAFKDSEAAPGMYAIPHCGDMKLMNTPEMQAKYQDGPVAMIFLRARGPVNMGKHLGQWFLLCLGVGALAAAQAGHVFGAGANHRQVFCVTGTLSFAAYGTGSVISGIWIGQPWGTVIKDLVDAAIYAGVTGGTFGWLWPH